MKKVVQNKKLLLPVILAICIIAVTFFVRMLTPVKAVTMTRKELTKSSTFYNSSDNKTYIIIKGPSGTSTLEITASWNGDSDTTVKEFLGQARKVTLKGKKSNNNPYQIDFSDGVRSTYQKDGTGTYHLIDFKFSYVKPAHECGNGSNQAVYDGADDAMYTSNMTSQNTHATAAEKKTVTMSISIYNTGIVSYNALGGGEYLRFYNTSATFNLSKRDAVLTYNANGGSVSTAAKTLKDRDKYGTLPTPTKSGSRFDGWYTAATGGTKVSENNVICGNTTIYAHWTKYGTLTFDPNGGSVSTTSKQLIKGDKYGTLPTPTRDGCRFDGWYTEKDAGDKVESDWVFQDDYTIYAHWSKYGTLTFDPNGGSVSTTSKQLAAGDQYGDLPTPTREDYNFDGWYTEKDAGDKADSGWIFHDDYTLYAHWIRNDVTISFNSNGGTGSMTDQLAKPETSVAINANTFTRSGYTFAGWATEKYTSTLVCKDKGNYTVPVGGVTLYAQWKKNGSGFIQRPLLDSKMFYKASGIEGESGTKYDNQKIDSSMAHIDKTDNPGYFTNR